MSSGITFSGFNQIDFTVILNSIMTQERAPVTALESQKKNLELQSNAFTQLSEKVSTLEAAAEALTTASGFGGRTATNTDSSAVGLTTSSASVVGTYDVVVTELARAQVTATSGTWADKDTTVVASGGTLTIGGVDVTLSGDKTLQGLADAINTTTAIGVNASIVNTTGGNYRLVFTGTDTGADNAFTITNGLTGGTGLTFTDTDSNGTIGDSAADNSVNATNASAIVNGIVVESSTNVIENAIPGSSLTVLQKDAAKTVTLTVGRDDATTEGYIDTFVAAYNDLAAFADNQASAARAGGQTNIGRDGLLRGLRATLRELLTKEHGTGTLKRLSEIGVGFTATGTLEFDKTRFRERVASSLDDVKSLVQGVSGGAGAMGAIATAVTTYTTADGLIPGAKTRLSSQIDNLASRLDALEARLLVRKDSLQREFIAADLAMSQLNNQRSALTALSSGY